MVEEWRMCSASGWPGREDDFDGKGNNSEGDGESRALSLFFISSNEGSVVDSGLDVCTIATPRVSRTRASHCRDEIVFPSNPTLKRTVGEDFQLVYHLECHGF